MDVEKHQIIIAGVSLHSQAQWTPKTFKKKLVSHPDCCYVLFKLKMSDILGLIMFYTSSPVNQQVRRSLSYGAFPLYSSNSTHFFLFH